jgi:hypothetical protein
MTLSNSKLPGSNCDSIAVTQPLTHRESTETRRPVPSVSVYGRVVYREHAVGPARHPDLTRAFDRPTDAGLFVGTTANESLAEGGSEAFF